MSLNESNIRRSSNYQMWQKQISESLNFRFPFSLAHICSLTLFYSASVRGTSTHTTMIPRIFSFRPSQNCPFRTTIAAISAPKHVWQGQIHSDVFLWTQVHDTKLSQLYELCAIEQFPSNRILKLFKLILSTISYKYHRNIAGESVNRRACSFCIVNTQNHMSILI